MLSVMQKTTQPIQVVMAPKEKDPNDSFEKFKRRNPPEFMEVRIQWEQMSLLIKWRRYLMYFKVPRRRECSLQLTCFEK